MKICKACGSQAEEIPDGPKAYYARENSLNGEVTWQGEEYSDWEPSLLLIMQ